MGFAIHQCELVTVYTCPLRSVIPLPSPFPSHPSVMPQSTSFGCLASYIKLALVIYFPYGNMYVSMLLSQIIPPSPPTESKSLFFMSAATLLPCMQDHWYYLLIPYNWTELICANIWYLSFSFWLTSLCVIGSRFIHLIRTDSIHFYSWVISHCG